MPTPPLRAAGSAAPLFPRAPGPGSGPLTCCTEVSMVFRRTDPAQDGPIWHCAGAIADHWASGPSQLRRNRIIRRVTAHVPQKFNRAAPSHAVPHTDWQRVKRFGVAFCRAPLRVRLGVRHAPWAHVSREGCQAGTKCSAAPLPRRRRCFSGRHAHATSADGGNRWCRPRSGNTSRAASRVRHRVGLAHRTLSRRRKPLVVCHTNN